jgi:chromosome segregation ATPase
MTPDDTRDGKHVPGLLKSYADHERELGEHATRLNGHDREIGEIKQTVDKGMSTFTAALKEIDRSCAEKVNGVHDDFVDLKKEIRDAAAEAKADAEKAAKEAADAKQRTQLTRFQSVGLFIAACGPIVAVVAIVWR